MLWRIYDTYPVVFVMEEFGTAFQAFQYAGLPFDAKVMGEIRPHLVRYWLHSSEKVDSPETFAEKVDEICAVYHEASWRNSARLSRLFSMPDFPLMPRSSVRPHCCAMNRTRLSDLCVFSPSQTNVHDETFAEKVDEICAVYHEAEAVRAAGGHTISVDEMTGIQALEHKYPDKPVIPGKAARMEFEYIRHGPYKST